MPRTAKAAAKPVEVEEDEFPQGHYMDKEPSETNQNFVDYVAEEVGYDADLKTVQLVIALYQKFQKSPAQREFNLAKKENAAKAAEAREKRAAEREAKPAPVKRASARSKAAAAEEDEEAPAPRAGRARRGQVAAAPAKRATSRRRAAAAEDDDIDE